jgi:hypothetical protein
MRHIERFKIVRDIGCLKFKSAASSGILQRVVCSSEESFRFGLWLGVSGSGSLIPFSYLLILSEGPWTKDVLMLGKVGE